MNELFFILVGYLSGSILYAYLLPKYICHIDIMKDSDDHNPGTFNAFALAGTQVGILVIALELLKGFLPIWLHIFWIQEDGCLHLFSVHLLQGMRFPCFIRNVAEKPSQFLLEYYWDCCRDTARCCFSSSFICYFLF